MVKAILRLCTALATLTSASLWAADVLDLPDFDSPDTATVNIPKPIVSISNSVQIQERKLSPEPCVPDTSDYVSADSINFKPMEFSNVSPSSPKSGGISSQKIPSRLNRPIRVGILTDIPETFIKQNDKEHHITANGGKLRIKDSSKAENVSSKTYSSGPGCISVSSTKKNLSAYCYEGTIELKAKGNKISVINTIPVEDYLRGVIPYEIGKLDSSRFEALKAQAVAARTYAYKHFGSRESLGFDVYADTKDQVYKGIQGSTSLTDKAVKETSGIVMTYNGEFITAYYHSTCGGLTETLSTWGKANLPYLKSVPDLKKDGTPWCNESSYSHWERRFSESEVTSLFKKNAKEVKASITNFSNIRDIKILDSLPSGRILTLEIVTDKGSFNVKGDKVRFLFKKSGSILPSSFFSISHEKKEWVIQGKGFGHGVGMCQMGVRARAQAGENFVQILTHYYSGIHLERFEK